MTAVARVESGSRRRQYFYDARRIQGRTPQVSNEVAGEPAGPDGAQAKSESEAELEVEIRSTRRCGRAQSQSESGC